MDTSKSQLARRRVPEDRPTPEEPLDKQVRFGLESLLHRHRGVVEPVNPLYILPPQLIDILKRQVRPLLSQEQLDFERELSALADQHQAVGFVDGVPIQSMMLRPPPLPTADEVRDCYAHDAFEGIEGSISVAKDRIDPLHTQLMAYVGWMVTDPQYQSELAAIRQARESARLFRPFKHVLRHPTDREFVAFKTRWNIIDFDSWDLPIPQGPNLAGIRISAGHSTEASVSIDIPPNMRLPSNYPLSRIMEEIREGATSEHLDGWNNVLCRQGDKRGFAHYSNLFKMYFFYMKSFCSRYAVRAQGRLGQIDDIFGEFLFVSEGSVKRLRLQLPVQ